MTPGRPRGTVAVVDLLLALPTFVVAVVLIAASPGPAMALVLRRAALQGWRAAVPTVLGLEAGLYAWALLAAAGFAALVAASEVAFLVLRVVGAGVLLYLGARAWVGLWRERHVVEVEVDGHPEAPVPGSGWRRFAEGALVQLANPKAAVFMVAFYPQFVPADRPLLATTAGLALLQVAIETRAVRGAGRRGRPGRRLAAPAHRPPSPRGRERRRPRRARGAGGAHAALSARQTYRPRTGVPKIISIDGGGLP